MDEPKNLSRKQIKIAEWHRKKRMQVRDGEMICGGYVIFRIDAESGRIMPATRPFEYPGMTEAYRAYKSLTEAYPDTKFTIYRNQGE